MMNILICTYPSPFLRTQGQSLRVYNISKHLAKNHKIFLLFLTDLNTKNDHLVFDKKHIFSKIWQKEIKQKRFMRIFNLIATKYSARLEFPIVKTKLHKLVLRIIKEQKIDILYINGFPIDLLLADFKGVPKVLDLCDSPTLAYKREFENSAGFLNKQIAFLKYLRAEAIEKYLLQNYDAITFISSIDATFSARLARGYFEIIPNGVDTDYFAPIPSIKEQFPSLVFFGVMSFKPNVDAVLYFYNQIFPKVRKIFPDVHFYVVGKNPKRKIINLNKDRGITVTGTVKDIRPFIIKSSIVVIPMRIGSGMKNKMLEAMALGKPIVCTSLAAEALNDKCKSKVFIADTPEEFAKKIIMLLKNEKIRRLYGFQGRKIVKEMYSWERSSKKYDELYKILLFKKYNR